MHPTHRCKSIVLGFCLVFSVILLSSNFPAADAPPRPPQEEDVFSKGVKAYSSGDYATAEKLLSSYLNNNPKSMIRDIGLLWYGRTLIALNRLDDARKVAESMDKEFSKSPLTRKLHDELDTSTKGKKSSPSPVTGAAGATRDKAKPVETKAQPAKQEVAKKPVAPAGKVQAPDVKKEAPKQTASAETQTKGPSAPAATKTEKPAPSATAKVSPVPSKPQEAKPPAVTAQAKEKQPPKKAEITAKTQTPTKPAAPLVKKEEKPKAVEMAKVQKPASKPLAVTAASTPTTKAVKSTKAAKTSGAKKEAVVIAKPKAEEPEEKGLSSLGRRDPFRPLVVRASDEPPTNLPPGKKGLQVNRLQLKGIVKGIDGYYAVVQSAANPAAIFLREKDVLHDGEVLKIYDDRIIFKHFGTDQLGKPFEEDITRRLPSGGVF
ncbi:MAG: hypothetical protein LAO31_02030 [Acidobacteriia bacterium]|nr:hypothetical protein [Terriglobia bacterium]